MRILSQPLPRAMAIVLVLRLALPLVAWLLNPNNPEIFHSTSDDSLSYIRPATVLGTQGRFVDPLDGSPELFRTPGLPVLLLPGVWLGNVELWMTILNIACACLTAYLIYQIAMMVFKSSKIAGLCAILYAFEPVSALYATKVLTENPFATVFTLFLYYFIRYIDSKKLSDILLASLSLAAATYIRPISYYLPLLIGLGMAAWVVWQEVDKKRLLLHAGAFFFTAMSLIGVWHVYNLRAANYPGFSAINAINAYYWLMPAVQAAKEGVTFDQVQDRMNATDPKAACFRYPERRLCDKTQMFKDMEKEAGRYLRANWLTYARIHVVGMVRTIFGPAVSDFQGLLGMPFDLSQLNCPTFQDGLIKPLTCILTTQPGLFVVYVVMGLGTGVYVFLTALGFWARPPIAPLPMFTFISLMAYFVVVSGGPIGQGRYRHPLMPIACIIAGYGLDVVLDWWQRFRSQARQAE